MPEVRIKNGEVIRIVDSTKKGYTDIKMTNKQRMEFDEYNSLNSLETGFSVSESKYKGYIREAGLAPWKEREDVIAAYAKYILLDGE